MITLHCLNCGKVFTVSYKRRRRKYCSPDCFKKIFSDIGRRVSREPQQIEKKRQAMTGNHYALGNSRGQESGWFHREDISRSGNIVKIYRHLKTGRFISIKWHRSLNG